MVYLKEKVFSYAKMSGAAKAMLNTRRPRSPTGTSPNAKSLGSNPLGWRTRQGNNRANFLRVHYLVNVQTVGAFVLDGEVGLPGGLREGSVLQSLILSGDSHGLTGYGLAD